MSRCIAGLPSNLDEKIRITGGGVQLTSRPDVGQCAEGPVFLPVDPGAPGVNTHVLTVWLA